MIIKEIWLSFIEKFLSILGKDSMQYKLQKYRLYGAKNNFSELMKISKYKAK